MKLRNKMLLSTSAIGLFFLTISSIIFLKVDLFPALIIFWALGVIFLLITFFSQQQLMVKRITQLSEDMFQNRLSRQIESSASDEIALISSRVNNMMTTLHSAQEQLSHWEEQPVKKDESEQILHKEYISQLAHYDNLTSLPNRIFFNEMLNKTLSHARRHNKILAVLFIDIDRFKNINDAVGKKMGDEVLKELSERFSATLRSGDILARLGGDEFIILLNDIGHPKFAGPVAEKLLQVCSMPAKVNSHEFYMTASIGICIFPNDGTCLEDLQKNADLALYKAKRAGGGIYQYFTTEMGVEAHKHIKLEAALQKAITNNEFLLFYQPKFNLIEEGTITGVEALIRWDSPEYGLLNPADFIPLAEQTGLIMQIGEWVIRTACIACKSWLDQGYQPVNVAVNISPSQFAHKDIAKLIAKIIHETGLDARYLQLEITETTVMDDVEVAASKLNEIKRMGVKICLDDFGTGYTSIGYLKKFPIDVLKIDQTFIKGIPANQNDLAIASAVIGLAHNLGMEVVAEGVETFEQLQFLAEYHCDMVQGYYLSRPLPEQKFVLQLKRVD